MIVIGSEALPQLRESRWHNSNVIDVDLMMTDAELDVYIKDELEFNPNMIVESRTADYCHITNTGGVDHIEVYIGHSANSTEQLLKYCGNVPGESKKASLNVLLAIKESHKYKRNSSHFLKTMRDIQALKQRGAVLDDPILIDIVKLREKETYNYSHPVLNQNKDSFFTDEVGYIYDHDSIHEAIAIGSAPAYKSYMQDGAEVMVSKDKFFACDEKTRLLGVYEETCVLALERSQIPYGDKIHTSTSFITALTKVCTSITSGWFREYAYDNFDAIVTMHREFGSRDYLDRFEANFNMIRPFKEGEDA